MEGRSGFGVAVEQGERLGEIELYFGVPGGVLGSKLVVT